jgi:hypothetical protein
MDLPHSQLLSTVLAGLKGLDRRHCEREHRALLVSDAAKIITGDTHYVDGGFHILA